VRTVDVKPVTDTFVRFLKLGIPFSTGMRTVVRFETLLKRLRNMGELKSYERIDTVNGSETMTATQACRFRELESTRPERRRKRSQVKPHYSLKEAARRLKTDVNDILQAAAGGRLQCFVMAKDLRGHWEPTGKGEPRLPAGPAAMPEYLALSPADCRQIAAYGSVNVHDLEYPAAPVTEGDVISAPARFVLREAMWVDKAQIVLQHPLPS
jgi:hypothetical protein